MTSFYVINPTYGFDQLLKERGYTVYTTGTLGNHDPDVVCWMGGTDINPAIYNEEPHRFTQHPDNMRDKRELDLLQRYKDKRKIGICRGAQLIAAVNGAKLQQHITGHTSGIHKVTDNKGNSHIVCSVHHQAVIPCEGINVIAVAQDNIPEVMYIPDDKALLFQGHPEFGPEPCTEYFFQLLEEYTL